MTRLAWVALLLALGCDRERPPPIPITDGSVIRDGGSFDGGPIRTRDAGPSTPFVNGTIGEREWEGAMRVESAVDTDREGSVLRSLRALVEDDRLYVGIEGTVAAGDSIVLYVDRDPPGEAHGVDASALTDTEGALDAALAQRTLSLPSDFAIDFAWGTTRMPFAAVGRDDGIGWRDVTRDPFTAIDAADAPSACTASACETSIPLSILGGRTPRRIALFARIVRAGGGLTNQALPQDDEDAPSVIRSLLTLGDFMPDAGMPDGGVVPSGIVVDGFVDPTEWAGATTFTNDQPALGPFAGNALRTLRVARDDTHVHVAIEATLTSGNAILVYVDRNYTVDEGLVSPTQLFDTLGALDRAISKELIINDPELRIDLAWGTTRMSHTTADDTMGWRDVATDPSAFRVVAAASACGPNACETSLPLDPSGDVALFVRLGSATSVALSNQTLPPDAASESVFMSAILPAR